jgi:hypothetical protein
LQPFYSTKNNYKVMRKNSTILSAFILLLLGFSATLSSVVAQTGTQNAGIVLRVTINGVSTEYGNVDCGYGTASWGGTVTKDFCAPAQWARDIVGNDSLVCDSIPAGQLTGKIALVRRGACTTPTTTAGNFSAKALNAQKAGALAVLVANNSATAGQTDCSIQSMGVGTQAIADQVKIPVLFLCRAIATKIDAAFKAGQTVEVCFLRPSVALNSSFYPVSSGQTPVSQIGKDTFGFSVNITNTKGVTLNNVEVKAVVKTAAGAELYTTKLDIPSLTEDVTDSLFRLPGLYAPELPIGSYTIEYFTKSDPVSGALFNGGATKKYTFNVTDAIWSKDVTGYQSGSRPGTLPETGWAVANYYEMIGGSKDQFLFKTVEFAHGTSATELAITAVNAEISLFLINDDIDENLSNFDNTDYFSGSMGQVGIGNYTAAPNATNYQLQRVELTDLNSGQTGVEAQDGKRYIVAVRYPDASRFAFHAFNTDHIIPGFGTMTYSSRWFTGGFTGRPTAVLRTFLDLKNTTDEKRLPESTMQILPNPVRDNLHLAFDFEKGTDVTITIAELSGRVIRMEDRQNLLNETLSYSLPELAAGTYLARVATTNGTLTKQFVVQK